MLLKAEGAHTAKAITGAACFVAMCCRSDAGVLQDLKDCVQCYRTKKEALLHNDLHTGNLLATASSTYLIDWVSSCMFVETAEGMETGSLIGLFFARKQSLPCSTQPVCDTSKPCNFYDANCKKVSSKHTRCLLRL